VSEKLPHIMVMRRRRRHGEVNMTPLQHEEEPEISLSYSGTLTLGTTELHVLRFCLFLLLSILLWYIIPVAFTFN